MEPIDMEPIDMEPIDMEPIDMEPIEKQDYVHALMMKVNRISIAAVLAVVTIFGFLSYQGVIPTPTHGTSASGAARLTMTGITWCVGGSSSNNRWLAPTHGPR